MEDDILAEYWLAYKKPRFEKKWVLTLGPGLLQTMMQASEFSLLSYCTAASSLVPGQLSSLYASIEYL